MAALTASETRPRAVPADGHRAGVAGTLRSEFTKIRSVRSTYWTLFLLVAAGVAWSIAYCAGEASRWASMAPQDRLGFDPTQSSIVGLALLGQLVIVVLGTLTLTSEYSTGMIRTSLTVMPRRGVLYGAKAAVLTAVALAVAFVTSFASFFIGQALLTNTHVSATLSQPNVLRAVRGAVRPVRLRPRGDNPEHGRGDDSGVRAPVPGAAAGQGAAEHLVRGRGPVAAGRRRRQRDHEHPAGQQQPAPVLRVGRVRGVRRLHGDPAGTRRGPVPRARRLASEPYVTQNPPT